jgi:hypothetical protein
MPYADPEQKRAHNRRYHQDRRAKKLATAKAWVRANPERQKAHQRRHHLKKAFGMTPEEYDALLKKQGGCCAICGSTDPSPWDWFCIDHDHETGRVRGLLCLACNVCIGQAGDDPALLRKAVRYLEGE